MLFLTSEGNYIEINKSNYINDKLYYDAIITVKGYIIKEPYKNINAKLVNIIKK
tara:strand:+ start:301 stop:462 length:162 start_codon:yes stop_codon:yes gene_type:complete